MTREIVPRKQGGHRSPQSVGLGQDQMAALVCDGSVCELLAPPGGKCLPCSEWLADGGPREPTLGEVAPSRLWPREHRRGRGPVLSLRDTYGCYKVPGRTDAWWGQVWEAEVEEGTKRRLPLVGVPKYGPRKGPQSQKASLGRVTSLGLGQLARCGEPSSCVRWPRSPRVTGPRCPPYGPGALWTWSHTCRQAPGERAESPA